MPVNPKSDMPGGIRDRLTEIIADSGLTNRAFAEQIGISAGRLSKMKCGNRPVATDVIFTISALTGVRAEWLHSGEGPKYVEGSEGEAQGEAGGDVAAGFRQQVAEGAEANGRTVIMRVRFVPHCPQCKSPVESGATVCPHCGKRDLKYPRLEVTQQ
jgi:transcriptional regulator with XRE-family HTH domain